MSPHLNTPQKPRKQQKPRTTSRDLQERTTRAPGRRTPQKPTEPPHKYRAPDRPAGAVSAGASLCGTYPGFCGRAPHVSNPAVQEASSPTSADSAVSATRSRGRRRRGADITTAPSIEALTVPEVMATLRMSRPKVYDLIRSGKLASFTEGRCRRIPFDAVTTYLHNKMKEAA